MTRHLADWIVPVATPPIRGGYVDTADDRICGVGRAEDAPARCAADECVEWPRHILCPALVNAHTHLELAALRGQIEPAASLPAWVRAVLARGSDAPDALRAMRATILEMHASGTGLVGDVSNTLASVDPLAESALDGVVFHELLGFDVRDGRPTVDAARRRLEARRLRAGLRLSLAAHAPYSVSPSLLRALVAARADGLPQSVHLAESREEIELLQTGRGPWRDLLEARGRWDENWRPCGSGPLAYLSGLGWLKPGTLAVHGVHLTEAELGVLAGTGATLVTCPRSNRWTGAGKPPIAAFYGSSAPVAIGTDSLASVPDLNLFAEMAELRRLAPAVPAAAIVRSATQTGAEALGFGDRGTIAAGMRARLIAVRCEDQPDDVEEYLLHGVDPDQVTWLA